MAKKDNIEYVEPKTKKPNSIFVGVGLILLTVTTIMAVAVVIKVKWDLMQPAALLILIEVVGSGVVTLVGVVANLEQEVKLLQLSK